VIKKVIAFIDGENLVMRYQAMVAEGRIQKAGIIHIRDRFLWVSGMTLWTSMDLIRVNYYACVVGTNDEAQAIAHQIGATTFTCQGEVYLSEKARLLPHVHKKNSNSRKTKVVDIHLTVDAMRATCTMPVDGIFLASGDGDYEEPLAEIGRSGKQAYLAAFSSGLEERLKTHVKKFVDLDPMFFEPERKNTAG
jgi:uncharacterized LabA/DUF88 family protein